jgi:hypothetical protein
MFKRNNCQIAHQTAVRIIKKQKQGGKMNTLKASQDKWKENKICNRNIDIEEKSKLVSGGGQTQSRTPWYSYTKITTELSLRNALLKP